METEMVVDPVSKEETKAGSAPTALVSSSASPDAFETANGYTLQSTIYDNKKWYIFLGEAFDNDKLYFVFANKDPIPGFVTMLSSTNVKRLTVRIEISFVRNPPSSKAINDKIYSSIRVTESSTKAFMGADLANSDGL